MLFNSLQYAIFLPVVFALYWLIPHKYRWGVILVSSYYFYMCWNAKYLLLIMFITIISYSGALLVRKFEENKRKKIYVSGVVIISLGLLFVFKYFNFIIDSVKTLLDMASIKTPEIALNILLPVGISFYTFQSIGYIVDVYRGNIEPETHIGKYAAFLSFFPQVTAGPIERSNHLMPQLKKEKFFNYEQATYGVKLLIWGYFKKMVVADTLAIYVDKVYADMHNFPGFSRFVVIFFFTVQIYCDFSGYTDIARGTAKLFGIDLLENFKSPYFASSIHEFWQRWHISLSTWFRDYVYIPLGGNRVSKFRNACNLMITFLLSGLWHGASWTFIMWGGLHGGVQIVEKRLVSSDKKKSNRVPHFVRVIFNFLIVSALWVFFRAQTFKDAAYMLVFWFQNFRNPIQWVINGSLSLGIHLSDAVKILFVIAVLWVFDFVSLKRDVIGLVSKWKTPIRWGVYMGMIILIFFLAPSTSAEFIYFNF